MTNEDERTAVAADDAESPDVFGHGGFGSKEAAVAVAALGATFVAGPIAGAAVVAGAATGAAAVGLVQGAYNAGYANGKGGDGK